ncbi:MAG: hypothetical protein GVY19_04030 [Bacteroidetes bacterium]|jgi:hypothetical protein|nr:hypothetical protein [Bacteroidota bacterium]
MPYRRLPNTDNARLKALKKAYNKGKEIPPFKLAYSQSSLQKIQSFLTGYEKAISEYKQAYNKQIDNNKEHMNAQKKARLYISHFIQVMNMAIMRGEMNTYTRTYYRLAENDKKIPTLSSEKEMIEWGEKIIKGEQERLAQGLAPITNPTIAVVKVRYENFLDSHKFQKILQQNQQRAQHKLVEMRTVADGIIQNVWNEVEAYFSDLHEEEKRTKAEDYGLIYVFRKSELKEPNHDQDEISTGP